MRCILHSRAIVVIFTAHLTVNNMSFIHELPNWPQLLWDSSALEAMLAGVRHRQGLLMGRMVTLGFELRAEATLIVLTNDVVKSSAIEGETFPSHEVRSSIARRLGLDIGGPSQPSRAIEGTVEMMLDATQRYDEKLTGERLFGWQASLFPTGRRGTRRLTVGAWRTQDSGAMQVVSGPIGREKVHFVAPVADRLEDEMARFLDWFNAPVSIDPVLKAALAHFWFVTIHPFEDGNGRIARAIADMSLARADGSKERCYSMSSQIESERREYYRQLEATQRGTLDVTEWLAWFLGCLDRSVSGAEDLLSSVLYKAELWRRINRDPVNDRQRMMINRLLGDFKGFLTTSKYATLAKCSEDSALRDVRELVERGVLVKNVRGGRSTSYRLAESHP